jgi:hypothetical protein
MAVLVVQLAVVLIRKKAAQQAHAAEAPSEVFIEVSFATLGES